MTTQGTRSNNFVNFDSIFYVGGTNLHFAENVRLLIILAYTVVKLPFSLPSSYGMVIQSMCAEEGMYGYNINVSGGRCASTVFPK